MDCRVVRARIAGRGHEAAAQLAHDVLERLRLVRHVLRTHGIEGDTGRELGGVVAVDAVALEQAPVLAGALGGRTRPVLRRKPTAGKRNAERCGGCEVLAT